MINGSPKILFVTYENPFTYNSGDSIYSCNIIEGLRSVYGKIDIIYYDSNKSQPHLCFKDREYVNKEECVKYKKKSVFRYLFSFYPGMVVSRYSKEYIEELQDLLTRENYDVIIVNHFKMMFVTKVIGEYAKNAKLIYISHNVESLLALNLARNYGDIFNKIINYQDFVKIRLLEKKHLSKYDYVTAILEGDEDFFRNDCKVKNTEVIRPVMIDDLGLSSKNKNECNNIIIGGSFYWEVKKKNLLLFLNAKNFNKLYENQITVSVVGGAPLELIDYVNAKYPGVKMQGPVESMWPYYADSKISIIPEKLGGGFKLKVIEAALSKNLIIAIKGAISKCNFKEEEHFVQKNTYEDMIEEIIFMHKSGINQEIVDNAYDLVKKEYTMSCVNNSLKNMID